MSFIVRPEEPSDFAAIRATTARAFAGIPHSAPPIEPDGVPGEASLVGMLRESGSYDARFALVVAEWRHRGRTRHGDVGRS